MDISSAGKKANKLIILHWIEPVVRFYKDVFTFNFAFDTTLISTKKQFYFLT